MTAKKPPKDPKPRLVLALVAIGITAGAAIAPIFVGEPSGPQWFPLAVWVVASVTAWDGSRWWMKHRTYLAVMKLRNGLAMKQLADLISTAQQNRSAANPAAKPETATEAT